MTSPIRNPHEYQAERLREARQLRLIELAKRSRQRPQQWRWFNNKQKEIHLIYLRHIVVCEAIMRVLKMVVPSASLLRPHILWRVLRSELHRK